MKPRSLRVDGDFAYVPLTQGYEAVIDAADVPLVAGQNWCASVKRRADGSIRTVYARRQVSIGGGKQKPIFLHRLILGTPDHLETDHEDGDGLNNRRKNLRIATTAQNQRNQRLSCRNTSGAKGVTWHARDMRWRAQIQVGSDHLDLGSFRCRTAAAIAYAKASTAHHGSFGRTA